MDIATANNTVAIVMAGPIAKEVKGLVSRFIACRPLRSVNNANLCGVTKRTLEPYVSGKYEWANARGKLLLAVSDALDIDPHLLVNGKVEINLYQKKITDEGLLYFANKKEHRLAVFATDTRSIITTAMASIITFLLGLMIGNG